MDCFFDSSLDDPLVRPLSAVQWFGPVSWIILSPLLIFATSMWLIYPSTIAEWDASLMHSERIALAIFSRLYSRERSFTSLWSPSRLGWWTTRRVLWGLVGRPVNGQPASPAGGFLPCVVSRYGGCGCQALGAVGAATASTVGAREDLGPGLSGEGVGRGVLSLPGCSGARGGG